MNERIKELAKQAMVIRKTFHGDEHITFDKEKFAELIVRECAAIVWNDKDSQRMLKHFGVEEK